MPITHYSIVHEFSIGEQIKLVRGVGAVMLAHGITPAQRRTVVDVFRNAEGTALYRFDDGGIIAVEYIDSKYERYVKPQPMHFKVGDILQTKASRQHGGLMTQASILKVVEVLGDRYRLAWIANKSWRSYDSTDGAGYVHDTYTMLVRYP